MELTAMQPMDEPKHHAAKHSGYATTLTKTARKSLNQNVQHKSTNAQEGILFFVE